MVKETGFVARCDSAICSYSSKPHYVWGEKILRSRGYLDIIKRDLPSKEAQNLCDVLNSLLGNNTESLTWNCLYLCNGFN